MSPKNDQETKALLFKALGKDGVLTASACSRLFDAQTFARLAGPDGRLDPLEVNAKVQADIPAARAGLFPSVRNYGDMITTSFDMIDEVHREAGGKLAGWVAANYKEGRPLHIIVVCTGNSRRSVLGAALGNIAADYYGLSEIRFHSGGTAPTALNARAAAALEAIGVEVEKTSVEASRGEAKTANPIHEIRWGGGPGMSAREFSKRYSDPSNPQSGFAALMVCSEADAACPFVKGASARISTPYLDPKLFDASPFEAEKYAERRDDIGRLLFSVMLQARHRLEAIQP